ncbi:MAG: 50S ribosomal protein L5 [bacterium]
MSPAVKTRHEQWIEKRERIQKELGLENVEAVPRIEKVVINVGVGDATENIKKFETIEENLARITGQKPVVTRARKSIAAFGTRAGDPLGLKVTLRGSKMEEFLARLINIALPRTRDFRGLRADSFDENGNYSLGIKEHGIFPEISYDEIDFVFGMDVTVVTSANNAEESRVLLDEYGFPLKEA